MPTRLLLLLLLLLLPLCLQLSLLRLNNHHRLNQLTHRQLLIHKRTRQLRLQNLGCLLFRVMTWITRMPIKAPSRMAARE